MGHNPYGRSGVNVVIYNFKPEFINETCNFRYIIV